MKGVPKEIEEFMRSSSFDKSMRVREKLLEAKGKPK